MGLYDQKKPFTFNPNIKIPWDKIKIPIGILAGIIIISLILLFLGAEAHFNPITITLEEKPFRADFQKSNLLKVNVLNVFPNTIQNATIQVLPITEGLIIFPTKTQNIEKMNKTETITKNFVITTKELAKGTYVFKVQVQMNNQEFEKIYSLQVV